MTILALDLGTKLGWAVAFSPDDILHGTTEFRVGRFESSGHRWIRFRKWLDEIADGHGPLETIYFEEVRAHRGVDAAHAYGGFMAHLTAWCTRRGVEYAGVPVKTIKIHATGKGNANKAAMIAAVKAWGYEPTDDNDADAIALLLCVMGERKAA